MKKTLPLSVLSAALISIGGVNLFSCASNNENVELTPVTKQKRQMNPNVPNIKVGNFRMQVLDDSTIRFEYKYKNPIFGTTDWLDDDTFFVPNRTLYQGVKDCATTHEGGNTIVTFSDIKVVIPDSIQPNLKGIKVYREGVKDPIYETTENKDNTGNLPAPENTPQAFEMIDYPRIIEPPFGYSASNLYIEPYRSHLSYFKDTCGFEIQDHRDIYVMLPRGNAKALRQQYRNLAGPSELVRLSTLGAWDSRYYPYNETTAQEEVDHYYENNLPLDNLVIDTDWRAGFDGKGYFVNETLFPNMPRFLKSMHDQNIEVCFNDHPEPQKNEYTGQELDVLNQQEVEFRRTNLKKILDMGLDTWWYDRNWSTSLICPGGKTEEHESWLNHETWGDYLYNNVTRQTHMAQASELYEDYGQYVYKRPIAMSNVVQIHNGEWRPEEGFTDSAAHRYSIQWTGDQNYRMLDSEIANVIKTGINSMPYMSSDLAGHNEGVASDYYYQRWIEYGALSPIFRIHCTRDLPLHCQPWLRGEEVTKVFRDWINLRYRLLPLYYSLARESYENGMPICRALGFNYDVSSETASKYAMNEYLIGNNILFAPCTKKDWGSEHVGGFDHTWSNLKVSIFEHKDFTGRSEENITDVTDTELSEDDIINLGTKYFGKTDDFAIRFKGTFTSNEAATKELVFNSDDGVRVAVKQPDGTWKTSGDWTAHGAQDFFTEFELEPGEPYEMVVEYFQDAGNGQLHTKSCPHREKVVNEKKKVYLPEGQWLDVFHGTILEGGKETDEILYDVNENAVFVRLGSMIPLISNAQNTKELDWTRLSYDVYPSKTANDEGSLYEDDFETIAYQNGFYHKSNYRCFYESDKHEFVVQLDPSQGWYIGDDAIANRQFYIRIHNLPGYTISGITVDGKPAAEATTIDADKNAMPFGFGMDACRDKVTVVQIDLNSIRAGHEIRFVFDKI